MRTRVLSLTDRVHLKMECELPSGSHKHRLAKAHVDKAIELGKSKITVGSCGNYGYSTFALAAENGMTARVFLPRGTHANRLCRISHKSLELDFRDDYEASVEASSLFSAQNPDHYDANCFGPNEEVSLDAYSNMADEIAEHFRLDDPKNAASFRIWVPVGNGTTLASIHRRMNHKGIRIKYGIVGSRGNSSPTKSMILGKITEIPAKDLRVSACNQPLVNYKAVPNTSQLIEIARGNLIVEVEDRAIEQARLALGNSSANDNAQGCAALAGCLENKDDRETHLVLITA